MVFAGQLFLQLISSKLLSAHTHTNKDETRLWLARGIKRLWSGQWDSLAIEGRKSVNGDQEDKSLEVWRWPNVSFVQATPVATRLWIGSQEQDPYSPFPVPVQLFPVWNWLLSFRLIKVLSTEASVVPRKVFWLLKLCNMVLKLNTLFLNP